MLARILACIPLLINVACITAPGDEDEDDEGGTSTTYDGGWADGGSNDGGWGDGGGDGGGGDGGGGDGGGGDGGGDGGWSTEDPTDADGDGWTEADGDCDDGDDDVHPGADDSTCDGNDDDCDGDPDDDFDRDSYEPNDSSGYNIGKIPDETDEVILAWLWPEDDRDRYQFWVEDGSWSWFDIEVWLYDVPEDADYAIELYHIEDIDGDYVGLVGLADAESDGGEELINYGGSSGFDDTGWYEVVVFSTDGAACDEAYTLQLVIGELALMWLLVSLLACFGGKVGDGDDPTEGEWNDTQPLGPGGTAPCGERANLEIVPLDIWGRDVSGAELSLDREPTMVDDPDAGPGVVLIRYGDVAVDLQVIWELPDHETLSTVVSYDGNGTFDVTDPSVGRIAKSRDTRVIEGVECPVSTLFTGLDHTWFAATGRAPSVNEVELAMDGQEQWAGVSEDLKAATTRVTWTTWWWESNFELLRNEDFGMSEDERWENTAMGHMEALEGLDRRVLVNRFWAENSDWLEYLNTDSELRDAAESRTDDFEVMLQGNPTEVPIFEEWDGEAADFDFGSRVLENARYADRDVPTDSARQAISLSVQVASYHQKGLVIDGSVAWASGMNVKSTDWDTNDHLIYDPHRMEFDSDQEDREDVALKDDLPDLGPRKDYGIRVEGPAARDMEQIIWERWEAAIDGSDLYHENASRFDLDEAAASPSDGVQTQIVATMPAPWSEMSIRESHEKAILAADNYIYIEDQYFRAPMMTDAIVAAMDGNPDLVLIVVTKDVSSLDGGKKFTYIADETFRDRYPDRYLMIKLGVAELYTDEGTIWDTVEVVTDDMDTHSKIRIVDDRYLSVGSCNFNNRGYKYEGELNVSVLDEDWVTDARERVFENIAGDLWTPLLSDDGQNNLDVLALAAEDNEQILTWWSEHGEDLSIDDAEDQWADYQPSGFAYPLEISGDYQFDVGPDAF